MTHALTRAPALLEAPRYAQISNRHTPEVIDAMIEALISLLTMPRSKGVPCFLDSVFQRTQIGCEPNDTHPDVLLSELWGFPPERLPKLDNTFCAEVGRFTDKALAIVFGMACPEETDASSETFDRLRDRHIADYPAERAPNGDRWKKPDFVYAGRYIVEVKYRFNSYEAKTKQIDNGLYYAYQGYTPVFLHLSPDFRSLDEFLNKGWICYTGDEALSYIRVETGIDFTALLRAVAENAIIRARMDEGHEGLRKRLGVHMRNTLAHADEQSLCDLLLHIAAEPVYLEPISQGRWGVGLDDMDRIAAQVRDGFLDRVADFDDDDTDPDKILSSIRKSFEHLDQEKQQTLLDELRDIAGDTGALGSVFDRCAPVA